MSRPRSWASTIECRRRACSSSGGMRKSPRVSGRLDAEVLERYRRQVGDAPRRGVEANRQERDLRVRGGEGAMAATPEVASAREVGELDAVASRDEELACIRIVERRPGAREGVGLRKERRVAVRLPSARRRREPELLAGPARNRLSALEEEHRLRAHLGVET